MKFWALEMLAHLSRSPEPTTLYYVFFNQLRLLGVSSQVIHFIRHAEGFHNVGFEQNHDAHLTPFGWQQTEALRNHIRAQQPSLDIEVTSRAAWKVTNPVWLVPRK